MFQYREETSRSQQRGGDPSAQSHFGYFAGVLAFGLALGALPQSAGAAGEIPFDVAEIFFELNNTDGDLGIHGMIDGGPWTRINIEDPRDRNLMAIWTMGRLRKQAVTELFFESAEPTFDELDPEDFFARFPAVRRPRLGGRHRFSADTRRAWDGRRLSGRWPTGRRTKRIVDRRGDGGRTNQRTRTTIPQSGHAFRALS